MRSRFKPTSEQRTALRRQLVRLNQPAEALAILRSVVPGDFKPTAATCTMQSVHPDRFVTRVQLRSDTGNERSYVLKVYSDDFGQGVWDFAQALGKHNSPNGHGFCLPTTYLPNERLLVFPWVDGLFLSEIVDERKPELLRLAARLAAGLHRLPIIPERPTTARMFVEEARARCDRLLLRWPQTAPIIEPLMTALQGALRFLDPADLSPIHGDMAAGQFLWTGERLVLLDLDMFGYTDPAYDAGHFLAQLERRCLVDSAVQAHRSEWLSSFRDAYFAAMPEVSPRNVAFYRGLTLLRKIYTICRREPARWPQLVPQLGECAHVALQEVCHGRAP
jgi:tRNA A-37 threonylcarbamoyl transferase component Bud32